MTPTTSPASARPTSRRSPTAFLLLPLLAVLAAAGCWPAHQAGQGPGHRQQVLGLTPQQEVALGKQAYQEILAKSDVVHGGPEVARVRRVGGRIAEAAEIKPLQREINLHLQGYEFDWAFNVLRDKQVNAFCLPGGKVAVYTGLLQFVGDDDNELATVLSHEIAHALAHHANERITREQMHKQAIEATVHGMGRMSPGERRFLIGLLSGGAELSSLKYDRRQESEADHIGLFLMTFAGYDPHAAITFWRRMERASGERGHPPVLISTHPSNAQRLAQMERWVPEAIAAKKAYDAGHVAGPGR
jgi:predicted Zn-dependent protease